MYFGNLRHHFKTVNSTLYGALMGGLLLNIFKKENKKITQ
jgi:hypothetical protein